MVQAWNQKAVDVECVVVSARAFEGFASFHVLNELRLFVEFSQDVDVQTWIMVL